jgi:hypothetical protein
MPLDPVAQGGVGSHDKDAAGAEHGDDKVEHGWGNPHS